ASAVPERWQSGRMRRLAKPLDGVNLSPGFESLPLRHSPFSRFFEEEPRRLEPISAPIMGSDPARWGPLTSASVLFMLAERTREAAGILPDRTHGGPQPRSLRGLAGRGEKPAGLRGRRTSPAHLGSLLPRVQRAPPPAPRAPPHRGGARLQGDPPRSPRAPPSAPQPLRPH